MIAPDFYELMNQTYSSIDYWPQPYSYMQWYYGLDATYQPYYMHPDNYNANYQFSLRRYKQLLKPKKPSRAQKRHQKKKQLQEELDKERREIGNWVNLERRDLIEALDRIAAKEKRLKEKRKEKLSHLIEIHKEVYKHYLKKGSNDPPNRRVSLKAKKKRQSYIKKMRALFEKTVTSKKEIDNYNNEDEWQSEEQEEEEQQVKVEEGLYLEVISGVELKSRHLLNITEQQLEQIKYMEMGKLTGREYKTIILREWVRNVPNDKLEDLALKVINRLAYKQAVRKVQKPTKAKKLIVSGIKECRRTLDTIIDKNRAKVLIVALNIERNPLKHGVDDEVQTTIKSALNINIPIIHISTRSKLGRAFTGKFGPRITMVSIINFEGYQDMMEELVKEWKSACSAYSAL